MAMMIKTKYLTVGLVVCLSFALSVVGEDIQGAVPPPSVGQVGGQVVEEASKPVDAPSLKIVKINCTDPVNVNDTRCMKDDGYVNSIMNQMSENKGMLLRTLYVSLGVTGIVVLYFVVRSMRLRGRRSKSRKYGIITQRDHGDVEMEPLGDGNDDDDDYTVFEMNGRK